MICLIGAPIITEFEEAAETDTQRVREIAAQPQLGMLALAAVLEAAHHTVKILNLNQLYYDYIASGADVREDFCAWASRQIAAQDADVYGFSSICSSYPLSLRMAGEVKGERPDSIVVFGGPQASVVDVETLTTFPFVDLIVRGEADCTLPALLGELSGERRFEILPGVTFRAGRRVVRNPNAPAVANLDSLPIPAYHHVQNAKQLSEASLELGRGCPFACKFCSTNDFFRRNFRIKSPGRVLEEMRHMAHQYGIRRFELVHDMFTVDRKRVASFCNEMLDSKEEFKWSCSARTDCVDDELLALMARSGCTGIFFGIEVGSARMQKVIDKHLDIGEARAMVDAVERHGMSSTVSLITGFPEEELADLRETVNFYMQAVRTPHANPQLNLLAPLAATPIHRKYRDELVLEELCSDVSHQGRFQNVTDHLLIETHPDIFPNFYLVPTPHLDRATLLELREFLLMAGARMRWLLAALHQSSSGILDVFCEWRMHRLKLRPELKGGDLRHYYRLSVFRKEFVEFLRCRLSKWPALTVRAFVDYEEALADSITEEEVGDRLSETVPMDSPLRWTDLPTRCAQVYVFELRWDLQAIIKCLQRQEEPTPDTRRRVWYATRPIARDATRVVEIGALSAKILKLSTGTRNIAEITELFADSYARRAGLGADTVCVSLIEALVERRFLKVCRAAAGAETSRSINRFTPPAAVSTDQRTTRVALEPM
jgi:radical SAM superfamily enzyme YgiQ (UPF0313 family)